MSGDCGFQRGKVILAGQATPSEPTESTDDVRRLRHALIREELEEYWSARDIVEIADAIGDMLYVVLGAAVSHGLDIEPIFEEIHRSNMTKFIDGHMDEAGKWIKGPSYSPANLGTIIERMRQ